MLKTVVAFTEDRFKQSGTILTIVVPVTIVVTDGVVILHFRSIDLILVFLEHTLRFRQLICFVSVDINIITTR
ncbi:hypothetical protein D3C87_1815570 [compost metagenome]